MLGWLYVIAFFVSIISTWVTLFIFIPRLENAGITGIDLHKKNQPQVAEMGGLGLVVGLSGGLVLSVGAGAFLNIQIDLVTLLAILSTILIVSFIGVLDDLLGIRQIHKSITPIFAALPLMAIKAGATSLSFPVVGSIEFGLFYPLILIPLGVTGAANAANMLAGFNGMEVGLGLVAFVFLTIIAVFTESWIVFLLLLTGIGGLLSTLHFNWYPSDVLIGDVGTLTIGAIMAIAVIVGNFETAGVILIIPYAIDFLFKAANGFPSSGWAGEIMKGNCKLHCPEEGPVSFPQLVMKVTGGITERNLVVTFMGIEAVFGVVAVVLYLVY